MIKPWEEILHTALIGTDKKQVNKQVMEAGLANALERAEQNVSEREEQFLRTASLVYSYRRASQVYEKKQIPSLPVCDAETRPYCSPQALSVLQEVLDNQYMSLLSYWLSACEGKQQLAAPEFIPVLLQIASERIDLRDAVSHCSGKRGEWLKVFNPSWDFKTGKNYAGIFDNGQLAERKKALEEWRTENPAEAREALEKVWKQEAANTRAELIAILRTGLSMDDEPFIMQAYGEKSQKVKEAAIALLKQLPGSFIINSIWEFVKPLISIKTSSSMMGLISKEILELNLDFELPKEFKDFGINELDTSEGYSEKEYSLWFMLSMVPPVLWEQHLGASPEKILELVVKRDATFKFLTAFTSAANQFRDTRWGYILFRDHKQVCMSVIRHFDNDMREAATLAVIAENPGHIDMLLPEKGTEWSLKFANALIEIMSKDPYSYATSYSRELIPYFPLALRETIDVVRVGGDYSKLYPENLRKDVVEALDNQKESYWENIKKDIIKLLDIKQQINQSF